MDYKTIDFVEILDSWIIRTIDFVEILDSWIIRQLILLRF
jgi:hypothetical protein